jgi:hypothetical protein
MATWENSAPDNFRQPFSLAGPISHWDFSTRELTVLGRDMMLVPHLSTVGLDAGRRVMVAGYDDPSTGRTVVTRLHCLERRPSGGVPLTSSLSGAAPESTARWPASGQRGVILPASGPNARTDRACYLVGSVGPEPLRPVWPPKDPLASRSDEPA